MLKNDSFRQRFGLVCPLVSDSSKAQRINRRTLGNEGVIEESQGVEDLVRVVCDSWTSQLCIEEYQIR